MMGKCVMHRGYVKQATNCGYALAGWPPEKSDGAAENTIDAYEKAMKHGFIFGEVDARLTKPANDATIGSLVVCHDPKIWDGYVSSLTLEAMKAKGYVSLEEMLSHFIGKRFQFCVEIKVDSFLGDRGIEQFCSAAYELFHNRPELMEKVAVFFGRRKAPAELKAKLWTLGALPPVLVIQYPVLSKPSSSDPFEDIRNQLTTEHLDGIFLSAREGVALENLHRHADSVRAFAKEYFVMAGVLQCPSPGQEGQDRLSSFKEIEEMGIDIKYFLTDYTPEFHLPAVLNGLYTIRNAGQNQEQLYARDGKYGDGRRTVFTWAGADEGSSETSKPKFRWNIAPVGDGTYTIKNVGQNKEQLYARDGKYDDGRRPVFTWAGTDEGASETSKPKFRWNILKEY